MQTLFINTNTQESSGDDTKFTVNLGQGYDFRMMRLISFSCPNYFSNFSLLTQDFSF